MAERTINEEIELIVKDVANNNPAPITCTVIKNYQNDLFHVDIETDIGILNYVPCLFNNTVGHKGIIVFIDGDLNNPLAIIDTR